jgi:hypothetical protein
VPRVLYLDPVRRPAGSVGTIARVPVTPQPVGVFSTNGGGGNDDGSGSDDDPNNHMFRANRSSCKGYRGRNSGSLRLDRTGRTSPDCKLRAAPRPEWPARITKRQQGLSVSSWMNLLNVSLVSIVEVLTKFRFCDAGRDFPSHLTITVAKRSITSSLVMRKQPEETAWPIVSGSFEP